jgi:hypothetical protein
MSRDRADYFTLGAGVLDALPDSAFPRRTAATHNTHCSAHMARAINSRLVKNGIVRGIPMTSIDEFAQSIPCDPDMVRLVLHHPTWIGTRLGPVPLMLATLARAYFQHRMGTEGAAALHVGVSTRTAHHVAVNHKRGDGRVPTFGRGPNRFQKFATQWIVGAYGDRDEAGRYPYGCAFPAGAVLLPLEPDVHDPTAARDVGRLDIVENFAATLAQQMATVSYIVDPKNEMAIVFSEFRHRRDAHKDYMWLADERDTIVSDPHWATALPRAFGTRRVLVELNSTLASFKWVLDDKTVHCGDSSQMRELALDPPDGAWEWLDDDHSGESTIRMLTTGRLVDTRTNTEPGRLVIDTSPASGPQFYALLPSLSPRTGARFVHELVPRDRRAVAFAARTVDSENEYIGQCRRNTHKGIEWVRFGAKDPAPRELQYLMGAVFRIFNIPLPGGREMLPFD